MSLLHSLFPEPCSCCHGSPASCAACAGTGRLSDEVLVLRARLAVREEKELAFRSALLDALDGRLPSTDPVACVDALAVKLRRLQAERDSLREACAGRIETEPTTPAPEAKR